MFTEPLPPPHAEIDGTVPSRGVHVVRPLGQTFGPLSRPNPDEDVVH